jgi:G3E family GTPase
VRQDLITVLHKLAARQQAGEIFLDAIIIETTGMADPAPVAQTFLVDDQIKSFARLDGIVTLVDAKHVEQHLDEEKPDGVVNEAVAQVAFADRLLLNKIDLVSAEDLDRVEARLRGINSFAPIQRCRQSEVSVDRVLNIHGVDLHRVLRAAPGQLPAAPPPCCT